MSFCYYHFLFKSLLNNKDVSAPPPPAPPKKKKERKKERKKFIQKYIAFKYCEKVRLIASSAFYLITQNNFKILCIFCLDSKIL